VCEYEVLNILYVLEGVVPNQMHLDVEGANQQAPVQQPLSLSDLYPHLSSLILTYPARPEQVQQMCGPIGYSVAGFHAAIAFAMCYIAMQMTNWNQVLTHVTGAVPVAN
jgi:hypothetical protein